jgi:hypothetical protein
MSAVLAPIGAPVSLRNSEFWVSHSKLNTYLTCPRQYKFRYVDRYEAIARPANLLLGSAAHDAAALFLTSLALGQAVDPVPAFEKCWEEAQKQIINFGTKNPADLLATGRRLMQLLPASWASTGYRPVLDAAGLPVVERELSLMLPDGIKVTVILDALVEDSAGNLYTLDFKFSAQASMEGFASFSDQLLLQQMAVDANAEVLGLAERRVAGALFFEGIKAAVPKTSKGKGPHYVIDAPAPRRSDQDVNEWIEEARRLVADIRSGRFPKRPMSAFQTPCDMCDFFKACHSSDLTGLVKKQPTCAGKA